MGLISKQASDQLSRIIRAIKIVGIIMTCKIGTLNAQKIVILSTQLPHICTIVFLMFTVAIKFTIVVRPISSKALYIGCF